MMSADSSDASWYPNLPDTRVPGHFWATRYPTFHAGRVPGSTRYLTATLLPDRYPGTRRNHWYPTRPASRLPIPVPSRYPTFCYPTHHYFIIISFLKNFILRRVTLKCTSPHS